jgi:membrane carboxypeptidase/penicillin-binding protein PbpC
MNGQMLGENLQAATVLAISDVEGEIWLDWQNAEAQPVVTPQLAYLMNDILSDGSARWQSLGTNNVLDVGFPTAAKIGRVEDDFSAWTVGYTPERVALVWMAANESFDPEVAAGMWHALIKKANETLPPTGWDAPIGITKMDVCDPSGLLPTADCPNIVSDIFLNGSEPSQYDNLYRSFSVNRETGYLATVFTSPALIEEKTYIVIPAEAQAWADAAGVELAPTDYDAILAPPRLADAHFTAPELFADVSGNLAIRGTASGSDFEYYRVQVGQGLNPQSWLQIGEDVYTPVENDLLALWDTSTLSGLYAIQLLVVHTDQRVEIATTQISIDNEYPSIEMIYPLQGEKVDYLRNKQIEIQVNADDNLGVESVAFYLDYQQIGILTEAPYAWTWAVTEGEHFIQVVARDRAGNEVEEAIEFVVER